MKKLMKPGPAISVLATRSFAGSNWTICSASARGFLRAGFASRIATLVAKSPCAVSRLRSISGTGSSTPGRASTGSDFSAAVTSCSMRAFKGAILSVNFYRIDVDGPAQGPRRANLRDVRDPRREELLQRRASRGFDQELRAMAAGTLLHRCGRRAEQADSAAPD